MPISPTNEPVQELTNLSPRGIEPPPTGQGSIPADATSNSAVTGPILASNSAPMPSPPAGDASAADPHSRWVPERDNWPPDATNKDTTPKLLADARAAQTARANPIPTRTADLLRHDTEPVRFFDAGAGSNVVFMLDNSMNMMTNGKSISARLEVVRALQSMNAAQSFYVLFFHSGGYEGMPSLAPIPASPENVRAMTNWLFSVGHRAGADPTKAMQRALGLAPEPDAVWLLSGSPLPEDVVDNIRQANAFVNARINTASLYNRDGEQALRRIAGENRGVYRFIPPSNVLPP
jgi:hypothetical protein